MAKISKEDKKDKYIMVTHQFGTPIYIAPLKNLQIDITDKKEEASKWCYLDTLSSVKLRFHQTITGYDKLEFEKI